MTGVPLWLLRDYLVDAGGTADGDREVAGDGWTATLHDAPDHVVGSLRVGRVRLVLSGADEAVDLLSADGRSVAMVHFAQVWPLDADAVRAIFQREGVERVVSVEGNATAQFASVLRTAGALDACEHVLRYDGMPFTGEEIRARVMQ